MNTESVFRIAFWILLGGVLVMRLYFSYQVRRAGERIMPDNQAIEREGRVLFAARFLLFFFLLGVLVLYAVNPPWLSFLAVPFPGWLRWIGFILGLASLALWTWTQALLGTEWSAQLQLVRDHHLVTKGPYARIRHPLYTALFCYGISLALVTAHWFFILFAILVIAGMAARVPKEEKMLIEEFGEEYRIYMQKTGRYLPKW